MDRMEKIGQKYEDIKTLGVEDVLVHDMSTT